MTSGPSGKKHLSIGLLLVLAGAFFVFGGLGLGDVENVHEGSLLILNQGDSLEGHTPRGFSGSGTGLFVGDNLNENFPDGDGLRIFLTFNIDKLKNKKVKSAVLISEDVHVEGTPFKDLGTLSLFETTYVEFSSKIWNNEISDNVCSAESIIEGVFSCDITEHIQRISREGKDVAQFIFQFERAGDNDGSKDLALFYKTDSNTNERGIFYIRINDERDIGPTLSFDTPITIPIVLHRVVDSAELNTARSKDEILEVFGETNRIWEQANINFESEVVDTVIGEDILDNIVEGVFERLYVITVNDELSLHMYFFSDIGGANGIAYPPLLSVISDATTVNDYRAVAHEIGHLLGLEHTKKSKNRLLYQGANGEELSESEIKDTREFAEELRKEIDSR